MIFLEKVFVFFMAAFELISVYCESNGGEEISLNI